MNTVTDRCVSCYARLKNLKLVGSELKMPWQSVYVHLKKAGVSVVGDKARYGTDKDRLAAKGESIFLKYVPYAIDLNKKKYQSKIDFDAYGYGVDIKTSKLKSHGPRKFVRWLFSIKKQEVLADFFVLMAMDDAGQEMIHCFLLPSEIAKNYTTISIAKNSMSKWLNFKIQPEELSLFFKSLPETKVRRLTA